MITDMNTSPATYFLMPLDFTYSSTHSLTLINVKRREEMRRVEKRSEEKRREEKSREKKRREEKGRVE